MHFKRIGWQTLGLTLLSAGVAAAATSPMAAAPINAFGQFVTTDVAYASMLAGGTGIAAHFIRGHEWNQAAWYSTGALVGGGTLTRIPAAAGFFGIAPAAMLTAHDPYWGSMWVLIATNALIVTGIGMVVRYAKKALVARS